MSLPSPMPLPDLFRVRQRFQGPELSDVEGETHRQLARLDLARRIAPGQSVAITAGSRGITSIDVILRAVVAHLRSLGAEPFIVPAMGSHGGGTAAGQTKMLAQLGITEASCGCPIRASMETVIVSRAPEGFDVHFDRIASEADHVLVVGRVKPHTRFTGALESGLMKMMLIGLGKHEGAKIYHRAIVDHSFDRIVRSVARQVLERCRICAGLAIVENAYDRTALIEAIEPERFETREPELLDLARQWMARLPFDRADVLILDRIGKDVSGAGMDTNVVGRKASDHDPGEHEFPKIKRICLRGISAVSQGNATGIGIAEFCLTRAIEQMDVRTTRINCLTGSHPTAAMLPLDYATDREMLEAAIPTLGLVEPDETALLWVRDTLHLTELECSRAYWDRCVGRDDLEILTDPRPFPLDAAGMLPDDHWS
ncbi:MAG TPA: lactate racemase domain-containing protein [Pirellulaceae bacterium]|nr:lactate racemase domain-containing protein [Pirellulaceae bacterium]